MNIKTYITNQSRFIVKDLDKELPIENHVFVEFLISDQINSNDTFKITTDYEDYSQKLSKDGYIRYLKLEISTKSNGNNVYWSGSNLINGNEIITDISEIIGYMHFTEKEINIKCDIEDFNLSNLQKCVIELQRKTIFNGLKNCNIGKCDKTSIDKQNRDFLFISLVVLENLICQKKWTEAESIIEGLSSCNSLCPNTNIKLNCNCNG